MSTTLKYVLIFSLFIFIFIFFILLYKSSELWSQTRPESMTTTTRYLPPERNSTTISHVLIKNTHLLNALYIKM